MENREMRVLSGVGILLVVLGHLGFNVLEFGELFPYYSFQVFIFMFISGYFYKKENEEHVLSYIGHKAFTLLLPYFIWNLIYGIIAALLHRAGFSIGDTLRLKTLFISPFLDGHQFMYNSAAWFVPVLFMIEVINVIARKILSKLKLDNEWLIMAVLLAMGIATVFFAIRGSVWGYYKIPGRILFLLPGFSFGRIYKEKLEKHDKLHSPIYFAIVITIQVLLCIWCGGLAFSAVWVSSFANGPVIPYITVITGIAFWLRISKVIVKLPNIARIMVYLGRNTYSIMMHHLMGFMLVKFCYYFFYCFTPLCQDFDAELFRTQLTFFYVAGGSEASKWIYVFFGLLLPLLIAGFTGKISRKIRRVL